MSHSRSNNNSSSEGAPSGNPPDQVSSAHPSTLAYALWTLVALALIAFFFFGKEMLIPVVMAIFGFFLFDPLVEWLEHYRVPRTAGSLGLVLLAMVAAYGVGTGVYGGVAGMATQLPRYSEKIQGIVQSLERKATLFQRRTEGLIPQQKTADDTQKVQVVSEGAGSWTSTVMQGMNSVFGVMADAFLIPILTVFLLLEKRYLRKHFWTAFGQGFPLVRVCDEITRMVKGYFLGNLVVGLGTAIIFYFLFLALGLENRVALALFAGFLNLVPIFGAILCPILPATQALLQFDHLTEVLIIFSSSIILHFAVNNIVIPKIVGSRINVNASAATVGLLFWGWLWSGIGLLIAIPMMAMLRILFSAHPATQSWANLISEDSELKVNLKKRS